MARIRYRASKGTRDYLSRKELDGFVEDIKGQMNLGTTFTNEERIKSKCYYGGSPISFARIITSDNVNIAVELSAPDKSDLKKLIEKFGIPYDEIRVDE